ncbi:hypothetical protein [uncultured Devosia sp.]|uniref:hypothetical protein n=1 Tax=uncultured Devosia sp. TaxID=211434 RepID=UPI0035CA319D
MQASAAEKAASTQAAAADNALALQTRQYDEGVARQQPWLESGMRANDAFMGELGLSDAARNGTFQSGFRETPGYAFQVAEGEKGVTHNMAALGMKNSGASLKALTRFRQGLADQTYGDYMNRVAGVAGQGQAVTQNVNDMGQTYANNAGSLGTDKAAATASGYVGGANAWTGALGNISNTGGFALGMMSNNFGAGFPWQSPNALGYRNPNAAGNRPLTLGYNL